MKYRNSKKKTVTERKLYPNTNRKYTLNDISSWVKYGLQLGVIKKSGEKEDVEMIMKWIDMLDKGNINVQKIKIKCIKMEIQLESVRKLKMRKHNFLKQLNDISYLLNIENTEVYINKANELTDKLINLQQQKFDIERKILEVDVEFSNINKYIKDENNIDVFDLVVNSKIKDKNSYLEKLNQIGMVPVKEYENIKQFLWDENKRRKQSYQLPKWM